MARWDGDEVVLAFVNLSVKSPGGGVFALPRALPLEGKYQARNLVAADPERDLWPAPREAQDLYDNGVYVEFSYPNEVQYLKLERRGD